MIEPNLKETRLSNYLEIDINREFYNFYHEIIKPELQIELDLKDFFDEIYYYSGLFYFNFESTPHELADFFNKSFHSKFNHDPILLTIKYEFIYEICFHVTTSLKVNGNGKRILENNEFFQNQVSKIKFDNKRSKIFWINGHEKLLQEIIAENWLDKLDHHFFDKDQNFKNYFINLFEKEEIKSSPTPSNGIWSMNELQLVELAKALYEHQRPKGINQKDFIENLAKFFNLEIPEKTQKRKLETIRDRKIDQNKFLEELSIKLITHFRK